VGISQLFKGTPRAVPDNSANGGGKVHKHMRTHGSEGATEPGQDGPGSVGPSGPAWPSSSVGSTPLSLHPKDLFNPKSVEAPPFRGERAIRTERPSTS
jgi:hypothetical protein